MTLRLVWKYFHFYLKQTGNNKNPGKNFFALNNTHFNNIYMFNSILLKLFKSRSIMLRNHPVVGWLRNFITLQWEKLGMKFKTLIAGWKSYFFRPVLGQ